MSDYNLVVLFGKIAAPPQEFDSEPPIRRFKVQVTVEEDGRIDVIPVIIWDPDKHLAKGLRRAVEGQGVWVTGKVRRRFWPAEYGDRQPLIAILAEHMTLSEPK